MDFKIEVHEFDSENIKITLTGRLNALSAPELKRTTADLIGKGHKKIIVDLSSLLFMDSSGMAALVSGLKATREVDGFFRLFGGQKQVISVLRLTKLDRVFEIYPDEESARKI